MADILVEKSTDFDDGDRRIVTTGELEIGVFHVNGGFYAYENMCIHQGGPCCEGLVKPEIEEVIHADKTYHGQRYNKDKLHIVCPWHGYEFDMDTGECIGDRRYKLRKFEVVEKDGNVYVVV